MNKFNQPAHWNQFKLADFVHMRTTSMEKCHRAVHCKRLHTIYSLVLSLTPLHPDYSNRFKPKNTDPNARSIYPLQFNTLTKKKTSTVYWLLMSMKPTHTHSHSPTAHQQLTILAQCASVYVCICRVHETLWVRGVAIFACISVSHSHSLSFAAYNNILRV